MNKTTIEWVRNPDGTQGYTWNVITGCLNHVNGLCKGGGFPCYAYKLAHGRLKERYLTGGEFPVSISLHDRYPGCVLDPFYPRFWEERLYEPVNKVRRWGRQSQVVHRQEPKGIFVCDMGDLFGIGIPEEWTRKVLDRFQYCPHHRFYLLTKQPQNLIKFSPFPENCWVGVTATNQAMFDTAYDYLSAIKASIRFISLEPLLSRVDDLSVLELKPKYLDQLIIGACTSQDHWELEAFNYHHDSKLQLRKWGKRWTLQPRIEWVEEIVKAADKAGIKVFLKDNLKPLVQQHFGEIRNQLCTLKGEEVELRQEMPNQERVVIPERTLKKGE